MNDLILAKMREGDWGAVVRLMREEREGASASSESPKAEPGPNWREDFDRHPGLWEGMERMLCPRVHFKCIIVDGRTAYFGSANLTGAGMGAKSERKRNFENGVLSDDPALVAPLVEQFDSVWRGDFCRDCGRRDFCGDCPVDDQISD